MLHSDEYHQIPVWVVQTCTKQIQDGGRTSFWKKIEKSPYLSNDLTDQHEILYNDSD